MYCGQCGKLVPENVAFCPECGAKQTIEQEEKAPAIQQPEQKKKKPLFLILVFAVGVLGIILLLFYFVNNGESSKFEFMSKDSLAYADVLIDLNVYDVEYSADHSMAVFQDDDTGDLYYIDKKRSAEKIAEEVGDYAVSYKGDYIAYITEVDDNYQGTLYLYCVKDGKKTRIDTDVYDDCLCISPEGGKVGYLKEYEDEETLYIGGLNMKSKEIDGNGSYPKAVSSNGKVMYYVKDSKLYVYDGKESEKIASNVEGRFQFNKDVSEVIYTSDDKTYFYTLKTGDSTKVLNEKIAYLYDSGNIAYCYSYNSYSYEACLIWGMNTLKEYVMVSDDGDLYWLNSKGTEMVSACGTCEDYVVSQNGKSLIYVDDGDVYMIERLSEEMEKELLYEGEVDRVVANDDLSKIYFSEDGELYYLKQNGKTERITNDLADGWYCLAYDNEMNRIFFVENDTLMYADKTAKSKTEVLDDVEYIMEYFGSVLFYQKTDGEQACYYMSDGEVRELTSR